MNATVKPPTPTVSSVGVTPKGNPVVRLNIGGSIISVRISTVGFADLAARGVTVINNRD